VKLILSLFMLCLLLNISFGQEVDSLQEHSAYKRAWDTAMENGQISQEERALLNIMIESLLLSVDSSLVWEQRWQPAQVKPLDQSGRWPLVLQNIAIGSGLYGWGIPYVLHAEDGRWYVGGVMVSAGGAFYLTYKYTKGMEMTHARTQMMRYGSILGLRYGAGLNQLLDLYEDSSDDRETLWMWVLMSSLPAGHYAGEILYDKYQPTNGQAWVLTLWTGVAGVTSRLIYQALTDKPDDDQRTYRDFEEEEKQWDKKQTLLELAAYPVGAVLGYKITADKQYSFGDALMLTQGWGYGFINTMMLQSLFFEGGDTETFFMVAGLGAIGSTLGYDHFIRGDDFTFGQSTLMLLGSASGLAFGFGTAILLNMNEKEPMLILALSGYGAGTWLTRSILDVQPDGTLDHNLQTRMSVMPTIIPTLGAQDKINLIPGIDLRLSF